jgi:hypothetical protein
LFTHIAISFMLLVISFCRSNWAHGSHDCKSAGPSPIGVLRPDTRLLNYNDLHFFLPCVKLTLGLY